jgi:hypothetical protein
MAASGHEELRSVPAKVDRIEVYESTALLVLLGRKRATGAWRVLRFNRARAEGETLPAVEEAEEYDAAGAHARIAALSTREAPLTLSFGAVALLGAAAGGQQRSAVVPRCPLPWGLPAIRPTPNAGPVPCGRCGALPGGLLPALHHAPRTGWNHRRRARGGGGRGVWGGMGWGERYGRGGRLAGRRERGEKQKGGGEKRGVGVSERVKPSPSRLAGGRGHGD